MEKNLDMCILLDIYGNMITKKQFETMDYYYNQDLSLSEISEHLNITRQGVRDSIKRAEQVILDLEDKLRLMERFRYDKDKIAKIKECLGKILELNSVQLRNNLIQRWVCEIMELMEAFE